MKPSTVKDYNRRINIWDDVPGNHNASKLDDMSIDYSKKNLLSVMLKFSDSLVGSEYKDTETNVDTFTYLYEIKGGFENETYTDEPYLIPYLVSDSDKAVIVIPGGGFGYKSMDGGTSESRDIAINLNNNGINAFVLHYRTNPYEYPIPYLDLQRAIRFIRYNAGTYHIDPEKISLIGFSAGGNEIATFINTIQGKELFPSDYTKDEIDSVDDKVSSAAMIYPALTFRFNVPMLFCLFNAEDVRNPEKREELLELTDLYRHLDSRDVKQFIVYGTKDDMVNMEGTKNYISHALDSGYDVTKVEVKGQGHGMKDKYYFSSYLDWIEEQFK